MTHRSFEFTHALCRSPAKSVTDGLRATDQGDPDPLAFAAEHAAYVSALRAAGCDVTVLDADEAFPDSVFIEDPALVLNGVAIVLRPGAPSRLGEAAALRPALTETMRDVGPGDSYTFACDPGKGLTVIRNQTLMGRVEDDAFGKLFARLYLGDKPPTPALREALLGK